MSTTTKGFTLVELLIAMAVSGIIMTGIYSAFKTQQDSYLAQEQVAQMQQNIRAGLYVMVNDIRMAGYDSTQSGNFGITTATASQLVFTVDENENGTVDSGETFTYELYTPTGGVQSLRSIAGQSAVAENIGQLEFYYFLDDDPSSPTTFATTPATADQLKKIRSIQVSLLAKAAQPDRGYTNNQTYSSASGVDWTPTPDPFRRRFETMTVKCRNMGL